ncbi:non-homologous end-joining DNA ligase [Sporolactobacillus sp. CPB3-1]|uniref:Non-homologous end-joining DNA ligase n=1 Tax=Sporolactobacillus mangiferae TaxID=2940498 RepID=A0ABT0M855_9BACL|nr:non-homologous end-joining DNA ligase [Sporolactobacillus mangiferae]MCL1630550.1 non-homologous end-joining DNA ligase [Sporolactobacillus mangiferae]
MKHDTMTEAAQMVITHPEKPVWGEPSINKERFIAYLERVAPLMLPFLQHRALTVIRYPHGIPGPSFFQKHWPDYVPEWVRTDVEGASQNMVCNNLDTLKWLGNQLAVEYHIPFQKIGSTGPEEIVFDLDPPERAYFPLAVQAAQNMHDLFGRLAITGFPKLSGSRGLQIHIPAFGLGLSYADTRLFTSLIAEMLVRQSPDLYTIERLKKNRGGKLYIDYVQHAEGKTIICPLSPRGKEGATVAAPLFWKEVNDRLRIESFTIQTVLKRVKQGINPMHAYFSCRNESLTAIIRHLKKHVNNR